jgi:methyl-accepting chemotaxis protein
MPRTLTSADAATSSSTAAAPPAGRARRFTRLLWRPGMSLMSQLRLPGKLALVLTVICVPIYVLLVSNLQTLHGTHEQIHGTQAGIAVSLPMVDTFAALQRLRGLQTAKLAGGQGFEEPLKEARTRAKAALEKAHGALQGTPDMPAMHTWPGLHQRLGKLIAGEHSQKADEAFGQFSAALTDLHVFMHDLSERTGMSDVDGALSRQLSKLLLDSSMQMALIAGELRSIGTQTLILGDKASSLDKGKVIGMAAALSRQQVAVDIDLRQLQRLDLELPGAWQQTTELVQHLVSDVESRFSAATPGGSAFAFFDTASIAVDQILAVQQNTLQRLGSVVEARHARLKQEALVVASLWLGGTLAMFYVVAVYYLSFQGALKQVLKGMRATAEGDLSHEMKIRGNDELVEIARAFDAMNERLSRQTSEIRTRAARVDLSGRQVADGSAQLAQRTDEQSRSVSSAVAAVAQISQAVAQNAQSTRELDELTERLFTRAEEGNAAMAETVMAMDELQSASSRVNEMVAVIDDVAFHTGMLALNASVEAARAGTAGKGFAVVAGEVRQLAMRCAEAADEIRSLISASGAKVADSSDKLQHVSVALDTLVNGVREVSSQLRVIASASTQQSASLQEVEANVANLDHTTRDNASLVEESNGAANMLVAQGEALTASVGAMRLRHGSADEARDMAERAVAHAQAIGRDKALAEFSDPHGPWVDRDLFVFAIDKMGNILANGMRPKNIGSNVEAIEGLRGTHHTDRLWDKANAGGGWVRYEISHPTTGVLTDKESFALPMDDQTLVACGCYGRARAGGAKDDMPVRPAAWSRAREGTQLVTA